MSMASRAMPPSVAPSTSAVLSDNTLHQLSDLLFKLHESDKLTDKEYMDLQDAAKAMYDSRKAMANPQVSDRTYEDMLDALDVAEMERSGYRDQLVAATMTIDHLKERRNYYARTTRALKGVCASAKITDEKLLDAYQRTGVKDLVLLDREKKRKRLKTEPLVGQRQLNVVSEDEDEHEDEHAYLL